MMSYARYEALKNALSSDLSLQKAAAKMDFAVELWRRMEEIGINKVRLAESLGKSAPWVTKVLSGDCNFTIDTMIALADAVDGKLSLHIEDKVAKTKELDTSWVRAMNTRQTVSRAGFARTFSAEDEGLSRFWSLDSRQPCNDHDFTVAMSG